MPRWTGFALLVIALGACQETQPSDEPGRILDQLGTREDDYHTAVSTLASAAAIRSETVNYAADMHDLIDKLETSSRNRTGAQDLVSGYTLEDMTQTMDQMRSTVDSYTVRVKHLEIVADLREAADEHQAAMREMFEEMGGMLGDTGGR